MIGATLRRLDRDDVGQLAVGGWISSGTGREQGGGQHGPAERNEASDAKAPREAVKESVDRGPGQPQGLLRLAGELQSLCREERPADRAVRVGDGLSRQAGGIVNARRAA